MRAIGRRLAGSAPATSLLVAPDSFKGTYAAGEVAAHIASGARAAGATVLECPLADGGEGTAEILRRALGADVVEVATVDPWRRPLRTTYALTRDGTAVIELAAASGLGLRRHRDDAVVADTFGTGLLVAHAVERGAGHIVIAAGGTATTDGGAGAVAAIEERGGLRGARRHDELRGCGCGVRAPEGRRFRTGAHAHLSTARTGRWLSTRSAWRGPHRRCRGFSGGMWSWYGAQLVSGADFVLDVLDFDRMVRDVDAVIVGEGRLDPQTEDGKIISAVLARIRYQPVFAVVGSVDPELGEFAGRFNGIMIASDPAAMAEAGAGIAERVRLG